MNQDLKVDKDLRCASCGDGFVFSTGEQELFRLRGITAEPSQCPSCARGRLAAALHATGSERPSR